MSTNHTEHYNLSLWEPSDQVTRTEFNENHAKIDAALGELQVGQLRLCTGIYAGTGQGTNVLTFPFPPKVVWIQKTFQWDEHLMIFGENAVQHQVEDAYGGKNSWCNNPNHGFRFTLSDCTLTLTHTTSVPADEPKYVMNRSGYQYMYMILG